MASPVGPATACRCGLCARPAGHFPNIDRSAARAASSTPSLILSSRLKSRCSRSVGMTSTQPSSIPTSSCRLPQSVSASMSLRVLDQSWSSPSLARPTSNDFALSTPRPTRRTCSKLCASSLVNFPFRLLVSPARRSRSRATSLKVALLAPIRKPKLLCTATPGFGTSSWKNLPISRSFHCDRRSKTARLHCKSLIHGPAR
ncbi:unannotated protein [freshwater metagenome]|uniref:Unannotated protein n=1 Tax=freshwater metagenome TaxID=449393 RepID=A0A6J6H9R9_9ZZZZ